MLNHLKVKINQLFNLRQLILNFFHLKILIEQERYLLDSLVTPLSLSE